MIEIKDLHVLFNPGQPTEKYALRGVDLTIEPGQFVTVIGSNGSGKSTLLNSIVGDIKPISGQILFNAIDVTNWSAHNRAAEIARVFQDPLAGTIADMTIEENMSIAWGRRTHGSFWRSALSDELRKRFADQIQHLGLGLENRLGSLMGTLSGGQRQAASLLMAALQPSRILLLDEHTAALDPKTADLVMGLTDKIISEQGQTTLMVTHSMRQALKHGDRTIMLHEGKIVADISGESRKNTSVEDLLHLFTQVKGEELDDDKLLLSS
ncbi:MAG: ABC transporter ATP-binding protein [Alphaproteobacteria bacterium]